jgi:hypothetical protein
MYIHLPLIRKHSYQCCKETTLSRDGKLSCTTDKRAASSGTAIVPTAQSSIYAHQHSYLVLIAASAQASTTNHRVRNTCCCERATSTVTSSIDSCVVITLQCADQHNRSSEHCSRSSSLNNLARIIEHNASICYIRLVHATCALPCAPTAYTHVCYVYRLTHIINT